MLVIWFVSALCFIDGCANTYGKFLPMLMFVLLPPNARKVAGTLIHSDLLYRSRVFVSLDFFVMQTEQRVKFGTCWNMIEASAFTSTSAFAHHLQTRWSSWI